MLKGPCKVLRENKEQRFQALVLLATKSLKALPPNLWLSGNKQAVCQLEKDLIHDHYLKVAELLAQHHSLPVSAGCELGCTYLEVLKSLHQSTDFSWRRPSLAYRYVLRGRQATVCSD